jgi:hypothetical protein
MFRRRRRTLRVRHEFRVGSEGGTRSFRIVEVTAGRPAGEVERGATDVRVEREKRQFGGRCRRSAPAAGEQESEAQREEQPAVRNHHGDDTPQATFFVTAGSCIESLTQSP